MFSYNWDTGADGKPTFFESFGDKDTSLRNHLYSKWRGYYESEGSGGVMNRFWSELSKNNQEKLADWIKENYTSYAHGGDVSDAKNRLEELRIELRREMISYGELQELESLKHHIDKDDVELRQAAGMKEMSETYIVDVVWRQLDEKGLGKFNLKESDIERLEDNYGSTYYFEVYDDTNENPISYIQMKNILDKSMKDMGLMDSNYAKGGEIKKGNKYQLFNYDINGMTNYEIVDLGKVKNIEQVYLKPLDAENRKEIVIPKKMFLDILSKNKYAKGGRWTNKTEL